MPNSEIERIAEKYADLHDCAPECRGQAKGLLVAALSEMRGIAMKEAAEIVDKHIRHVELSPGVGADCQKYGIAVANDIKLELELMLGEDR